MIIPCIDLKAGKVVQLIRGEHPAIQIDDPGVMLRRFEAFPMIHVIDLDGATGDGSNLEIVRKIAARRACRVGGGVRTWQRARELIDGGAKQVIVGTAAFTNEGVNEHFLERVAEEVGPKNLCIALDCKGGQVAVHGWRHTLPFTAERVLPTLEKYCQAFLCTYVDNEGTMTGGDLDWYRRLRQLTGHSIIAAGGLSTLEEICALQAIDVDVALGMAIYTGKLDLQELVALQESPVRPHIRLLAKYEPTPPVAGEVRLDGNENPLGPSPLALKAIQEALGGLHRYPDPLTALKKKLAERLNLKPENIAVGNGSDELIHLLGLCLLDSGDEMIVGHPTFVRYEAAGVLAKAGVRRVPLDAKMGVDLPAMAAQATERTKLIFVANPNSPSGTIVGKEPFEEFLADLPKQAIVVLDEAYGEYVEGQDVPLAQEYVREGRRVIGLGTFSKAYGLAGLRVGYALASPDVVEAIDRLREPYSVNRLALAGAIAALDDHAHLAKTLQQASQGREALSVFLRSRGATVFESHANFVLADLHRDAKPIVEGLAEKGIFIRAISSHQGFVRITVGTDEELASLERTWPD